jgi:hypothetical protein
MTAAAWEVVMPIGPLLRNGHFSPEDITLLTEVFEKSLQDLQLADRNNPTVELVAKRVIELASQGERNPKLLRDAVLKSFQK